MRGWFALGAVTLWVLTAGPVLGQEIQYQVGNQLEAWYDTDLEETLIDNRLDVLGFYGPLSVGAVFISHSPSDASKLDPNDYGPQMQGVRKRWLEFQQAAWGIRVGDIYGGFGRGLALQIFEDQTVDFDNALDGFAGRGSVGRYDFQILGGTNSFEDPLLVMKAASVRTGLPGGFRAGMHGVWADTLAPRGGARPGGDRLYGGLLEGELGSFADVYGEYVMRDYRNFRQGGQDGPQGHAGYANLNLYLGPLTLVGEFKDMLRYVPPPSGERLRHYVNPPTAVRQHATTLLNRGSHVPNIRFSDERGGLAEAVLRVCDRTRLTGSFSRSEARRPHLPAWEAYGEVERKLGRVADLYLRLAEAEETIMEGVDPIFFERITYGGTLIMYLSSLWSLDITGETQQTQESNRNTQWYSFPEEHRTNIALLTVSRAPSMSWGLTVEWTDDERESTRKWIWGEVSLQLGRSHQLILGGGRQRGGQICSGGVCKLVDPFEGGRIELLTHF